MPAPLALQMARGAQVYYLGKYDTLDGWALIRTGQPEFYYATPGNKALVMGLLFDEKGEIQTINQFQSLDMTQKGGVIDMMAGKIAEKEAAQPGAAPAAAPAPAPTPGSGPAINPNGLKAAMPFAVAAPTAAAPADPNAPAINELVRNTPGNQLFNAVKSGNSILWGEPGKASFYALIDPNCTHCQDFLKQIEPLVEQKIISVYIYPVGFDDQSKIQAAFALAASDGAKRLLDYAKGKTDALPAPENLDVAGVNANVQILSDWDLMATPIILYQAGKTGEVKLIRGRPSNLDATMMDLLGM